jgi:hypothetical protein
LAIVTTLSNSAGHIGSPSLENTSHRHMSGSMQRK